MQLGETGRRGRAWSASLRLLEDETRGRPHSNLFTLALWIETAPEGSCAGEVELAMSEVLDSPVAPESQCYALRGGWVEQDSANIQQLGQLEDSNLRRVTRGPHVIFDSWIIRKFLL